MTRVKVCGLTRSEDARLAAELGADALGFVFVPGSPRWADPGEVARIVAELPPFVATVGVFADQPLEEVRAVAAACRLDWVQLHGSESQEYVDAFGGKVLKALCLKTREDLAHMGAYPRVAAFLLDAARGGSGQSFDWAWATKAQGQRPIVLAGGLHPANVAEAIRRVRPWAVDAASGTEARPGVKDPAKLRAFVQAVRAEA